jgi:hypothetical protein
VATSLSEVDNNHHGGHFDSPASEGAMPATLDVLRGCIKLPSVSHFRNPVASITSLRRARATASSARLNASSSSNFSEWKHYSVGVGTLALPVAVAREFRIHRRCDQQSKEPCAACYYRDSIIAVSKNNRLSNLQPSLRSRQVAVDQQVHRQPCFPPTFLHDPIAMQTTNKSAAPLTQHRSIHLGNNCMLCPTISQNPKIAQGYDAAVQRTRGIDAPVDCTSYRYVSGIRCFIRIP